MENSTFYNTRSINFIKILNKILVAFLIVVLVLIFALRLNDTVSFKEGQIYSNTVYAPKGAAVLGIDWADVEAKYRALVPYANLSGNNLETSMTVIRRFREAKKVSELVELLR